MNLVNLINFFFIIFELLKLFFKFLNLQINHINLLGPLDYVLHCFKVRVILESELDVNNFRLRICVFLFDLIEMQQDMLPKISF